MKKLITIILIIAAGQAYGQKSDTLHIQYSPKIKYIKFGERVYEVVQPSLKECQSFFIWGEPGYLPVDSSRYYGVPLIERINLPANNLLLKQ